MLARLCLLIFLPTALAFCNTPWCRNGTCCSLNDSTKSAGWQSRNCVDRNVSNFCPVVTNESLESVSALTTVNDTHVVCTVFEPLRTEIRLVGRLVRSAFESCNIEKEVVVAMCTGTACLEPPFSGDGDIACLELRMGDRGGEQEYLLTVSFSQFQVANVTSSLRGAFRTVHLLSTSMDRDMTPSCGNLTHTYRFSSQHSALITWFIASTALQSKGLLPRRMIVEPASQKTLELTVELLAFTVGFIVLALFFAIMALRQRSRPCPVERLVLGTSGYRVVAKSRGLSVVEGGATDSTGGLALLNFAEENATSPPLKSAMGVLDDEASPTTDSSDSDLDEPPQGNVNEFEIGDREVEDELKDEFPELPTRGRVEASLDEDSWSTLQSDDRESTVNGSLEKLDDSFHDEASLASSFCSLFDALRDEAK